MEELESRRTLVSDTLVVDKLEMVRALGELAGAFRGESVSLLANFVTRILEEFVTSRTGLSDALVTDFLESTCSFTGNQDTAVVF